MKKYFSSYWIKSAFYTVLQRFSMTLLGFISYLILIRSLSTVEMGAWAIFLAVTSIFEISKTNLLKNAHIRFVSIQEDHTVKASIASSAFLINAAMNIAVIILIIFGADWLGRIFNSVNDLPDMLRWFIPGLLGMIIFSHLEAIQQSFLDFKGPFAGNFVRQLLFFSAVCAHAIWKVPFSLKHLAMYQSISIWIGTGVLFLSSRKYLLYKFNYTKQWLKEIVQYGGFIFSSGFVGQLFANIDQLMTATFLRASDVAYYNAAGRINQVIDIPSYAASDIMFPKVAQASQGEENGDSKVRYLYERMVAVLLSFTIPAAIFVIIFPHFVITIIAGSNEYAPAALILQIYMVMGIMRPMQNQSANLLNSIGRPGLCLLINAVSLVVNLGINYACLVHFGFYGAAIGTLITCIVGSIAWYIIMKKLIGANMKSIFVYMIDVYKLIYTKGMGLFQKVVLKKNNAGS